jgi:predicted GNAT family N-acyltransferase
VVIDEGRVVATCRLRWVGEDLKLERMAVERELRGAGVGSQLLGEAERIARERGTARMMMHAQTQARGFYEAHGYEPEGEPFLEAGIEHVRMIKPLGPER